MMSNWEIVKAEDFCFTVTDGTHDSPKAKENGHYLITSKHLAPYNIDFSSAKKISEEDYQKVIKRSPVEQWDILFSMIGTIGITYLEKNTDIDYACKNMGIFKFNGDKDKAYWLYYYLQTPQAKEYILGHLRGTTQQYLPLGSLRDFPIQVPAAEIRNNITSILRSLDDRIAVNTAINENLEQQAQALFKAWFVDFEPFGGVMPDDWTETTLGTIAAISTKSINPLKQPDLYLEHYSIPAYDEQHYPVFEYASEVKSNKYILTNNSVMISKLNPDTKRIWRPLCLSANPVCSTEFIVYESVNPKYKDYIYSLIDSQSFSDYLCAHTTGSTNSRQRATPKTTLDFPCVLPTDDTMSQFCGVVTPIYNQIGANLIENQRLAFLRDTLLPKLMNGEIDVSEVKI